jgi:hypothetical protein
MQEKKKELTNMGLRSYVEKLDTQEQMQLKAFIAMKFGKSYMTINDKIKGRTKFSQVELLALQPIIDDETWRQ